MARASKIYVVHQTGNYLLGAFTVKHEMYTFAERYGWFECEGGAVVTEVPDGLVRVTEFKRYPLVRPEPK